MINFSYDNNKEREKVLNFAISMINAFAKDYKDSSSLLLSQKMLVRLNVLDRMRSKNYLINYDDKIIRKDIETFYNSAAVGKILKQISFDLIKSDLYSERE